MTDREEKVIRLRTSGWTHAISPKARAWRKKFITKRIRAKRRLEDSAGVEEASQKDRDK
ncbi:MAG TPA: hypothetical protein V6C81_27735 [Planktothrix sp.]